MTELSPELQEEICRLRDATEEPSEFMKRAVEALQPLGAKTVKKDKPVKKSPPKPELSPIDKLAVWFATRLEELKQRLLKGHGSGVNADKLDDLHADELMVKAASLMPRGGGVGVTTHLQLQGVSANQHHTPTAAGDLDHGGLQGLGDDDHTQYLKETTGGNLAGNLTMLFNNRINWMDDIGAVAAYFHYNSVTGDFELVGGLNIDNFLGVDTINEYTSAAGVTVDGVKLKDSEPYCDVINEKTGAAGVTVDGVKLKDSEPYCDVINEKTGAAGVTVDSVLLKDGNVELGAGKIKADEFVLRNAATFTGLDVRNAGDTLPGAIMANVLYMQNLFGYTSITAFATRSSDNSYFRIRVWDNTLNALVTTMEGVDGKMSIPLAGDITMLADKTLVFTESTGLTIAAGVITIAGTNTVITPQGGAVDDLDTINGGTDGEVIIIRGDGTFTVTVKDGTGNINCAGDFAMDVAADTMMLIYDGSNAEWLELSRSNNA